MLVLSDNRERHTNKHLDLHPIENITAGHYFSNPIFWYGGHKNIKNRFTDASLISKDEDDRRNKMAAKQLQQDVNSYVKTIDGLFLYMDRLNSGNFA